MTWVLLFEQFLHNEKEPMLFHTGMFLFLFAIFLLAYSYLFNKPAHRSLLLILFGFYFYYKASGIFLFLLLLTISADFFFAGKIVHESDPKKKKWWLISGIVFSLSFLLYFKYKNFFLENFGLISGQQYSLTQLILPIGISFYTFQSISFLVDIYKSKIKLPKYQDYLLYMTFFPHLVAGPIVRAADFLPQLKRKLTIRKKDLKEASFLILKGFVKKAIIADYVAQYSDIVFSDPTSFSATESVFAVLAYTLQIFCDFSGYTDMAIGIALLLGYRLCTNFQSPYKSFDITDFWRRWHISLSSWLRDYIYIPLGGNKKGVQKQLLFLFVTMLIGGFWHGADWKFIFWGAGHGLLLIFHKLSLRYPRKEWMNTRWFNVFSWALTFSVVALLWVPFRANSMEDTFVIYGNLFSGFEWKMVEAIYETHFWIVILLLFGYFGTLMKDSWKTRVYDYFSKLDYLMLIVLFLLVIQVMLQFKSATVQPFIYFQF
jgi:D-alanyl-lipoteichoic acid acyltransferase DltB (MBOAT superfamily)